LQDHLDAILFLVAEDLVTARRLCERQSMADDMTRVDLALLHAFEQRPEVRLPLLIVRVSFATAPKGTLSPLPQAMTASRKASCVEEIPALDRKLTGRTTTPHCDHIARAFDLACRSSLA
jgi:hypothetical protein